MDDPLLLLVCACVAFMLGYGLRELISRHHRREERTYINGHDRPSLVAELTLAGAFSGAAVLSLTLAGGTLMPVDPDDLTSAVRYALVSTRATVVCPFHLDVIIRIGDDAAESHAWARARKIAKSDGTKWRAETLKNEFDRQLNEAADGCCPLCAQDHFRDPRL
jgi:hypothetical protein